MTLIKGLCRFLSHSGCSYAFARKRTVFTQPIRSLTTSYALRLPVSTSDDVWKFAVSEDGQKLSQIPVFHAVHSQEMTVQAHFRSEIRILLKK
jgi:hypothetical protein